MAMMFFRVNSVSRTHGANAVARAAYNSRDRLRAASLHRSFDYRARGGLEHSEILLPQHARAGADWARDRTQLWNAAEDAEHRRNSRVAREYLVALPHELSPAARLQLARGFAQGIADRYGGAVDLAIHQAPPGGDPRNFHAHMLSTTREVSEHGLGNKTWAEIPDGDRRARGLASGSAEMHHLRHWWADRANEQLREAGLDLHLDPRSHWERGDVSIPQPALTHEMILLERAGVRCLAAERLRAAYVAREQLLREWRQAHARSPAQELPSGLAPADPARSAALDVTALRSEPARELTPAEREQQAIERWLAYRNDRTKGSSPGLDRARERNRDHGAELDF
jgi:hypothetical protein